jgi:DNA-directed RNA polymerase specialized sigma subunit
MFKLHDIRKTRVWQEAHEEGRELEKQKFVKILLTEGRTQKDIAKMLDISVSEVRRLAKR